MKGYMDWITHAEVMDSDRTRGEGTVFLQQDCPTSFLVYILWTRAFCNEASNYRSFQNKLLA